MWQHISVFAGEACSGETTDCERPNTSTAARVGTLLLEGVLVVEALRSVTFVVPLGSAIIAVAARIRSLFFAITVRSVIVIITDSAIPPQPIQDQTRRPNS